MIFLRNIWRLFTLALIALLLVPVFAVPTLAGDDMVRVKIRSHCNDNGCVTKMITGADNKIQVLSSYNFFLAQGMMRRHHHFEDYLPQTVYAKEIIFTDKNAPDNQFIYKSGTAVESEEKISKVAAEVSSDFLNEISQNIYLNQDASVIIDCANGTVVFRTGSVISTATDISISLR